MTIIQSITPSQFPNPVHLTYQLSYLSCFEEPVVKCDRYSDSELKAIRTFLDEIEYQEQQELEGLNGTKRVNNLTVVYNATEIELQSNKLVSQQLDFLGTRNVDNVTDSIHSSPYYPSIHSAEVPPYIDDWSHRLSRIDPLVSSEQNQFHPVIPPFKRTRIRRTGQEAEEEVAVDESGEALDEDPESKQGAEISNGSTTQVPKYDERTIPLSKLEELGYNGPRANCGSNFAYPFFISFYMVCSFLVSLSKSELVHRFAYPYV